MARHRSCLPSRTRSTGQARRGPVEARGGSRGQPPKRRHAFIGVRCCDCSRELHELAGGTGHLPAWPSAPYLKSQKNSPVIGPVGAVKNRVRVCLARLRAVVQGAEGNHRSCRTRSARSSRGCPRLRPRPSGRRCRRPHPPDREQRRRLGECLRRARRLALANASHRRAMPQAAAAQPASADVVMSSPAPIAPQRRAAWARLATAPLERSAPALHQDGAPPARVHGW
jgi:hypothetical protein